eukprot:scaffold42393_cov23-Tisochrysis_lutea.AAC.1
MCYISAISSNTHTCARAQITVEAPPGVKKNLQRTYEGWSSQLLAAGPPMHAQLMFVLAWFHAVVQERRSFIPQGWSKFYEFSTADLRSGADVVMMALKGADGSCQLLVSSAQECTSCDPPFFVNHASAGPGFVR